jgi:hypothetical protein
MASRLLMSSGVLVSTFRRHASLCTFVLALVPGCFDPSAMGDSDTDDEAESSTGMEDPGDGMELLANGSFEMWSSGSPQAWTDGDAMLAESTSEVVDGDRAVLVRSTIYNSIGQRVATPLPAGSCLELDLSLRWEDGSAEAPVVQILGRDQADMDNEHFADLAWSSDGEWQDTSASFLTEEAWTSFSIHVLSTASVEQSFSMDDASLRLVPCA